MTDEHPMTPELSAAAGNCPIIATMLKAGETPDTILLLLSVLKIQLSQDLDDLKFTEPKRVRMPDGLWMLWVRERNLLDDLKSLWKLPRPTPTGD